MYTDKKNILQLVALLEAHGVKKIVLCPGSRNIPLVHTLSTHSSLSCNGRAECRLFCYRAGFERGRSGRCLLYIGYGIA